jgi:hypothetical protein
MATVIQAFLRLFTAMQTEPNKTLEPTRLLVTDRAPSSTLRAK